MGIYYETAFTNALNEQNFNYIDDMDEVELFISEYLNSNGSTLIKTKMIEIENNPRRLRIEYNTSIGSTQTTITINDFK